MGTRERSPGQLDALNCRRLLRRLSCSRRGSVKSSASTPVSPQLLASKLDSDSQPRASAGPMAPLMSVLAMLSWFMRVQARKESESVPESAVRATDRD
jgi:hypothetical protein